MSDEFNCEEDGFYIYDTDTEDYDSFGKHLDYDDEDEEIDDDMYDDVEE